MSASLSNVRHMRGFDIVKPLNITAIVAVMLPLILLPLTSIFLFGTSKSLASFWASLTAPADVLIRYFAVSARRDCRLRI